MIHTEEYIETHGIPATLPAHHNSYESEEAETELVYKPKPVCGMCQHLYQSKHPKAKSSPWGYCPLLDAERRMSDKPCRLYQEDVPF